MPRCEIKGQRYVRVIYIVTWLRNRGLRPFFGEFTLPNFAFKKIRRLVCFSWGKGSRVRGERLEDRGVDPSRLCVYSLEMPIEGRSTSIYSTIAKATDTM